MQNTKKILCSDGKNRIHHEFICQICKNAFYALKRKNKTRRFCSQNCTLKSYEQSSIIYNCAWCLREFKRKRSTINSSKHKIYFCCRKCKDSAQKLGGIKEIQPPHYGTRSEEDKVYEIAIYRKIWTDAGNLFSCKRCNYNEFESSVHIHHIDHNKLNNNISNLISLCANCHLSLHHGNWNIKDI